MCCLAYYTFQESIDVRACTTVERQKGYAASICKGGERMRIALFGGTGLVGGYLVDELINQAHEPVLLVRPGSEPRVRHGGQCVTVTGDVTDPGSVRRTLEGCEAAIYNIGILREFPRKGITFEQLQFQSARCSIDAAGELGVRRFVLMSPNGARQDGTPYQRTKFQAEQHLCSSKLDYTILRPSIIFGDPRGRMEICTQLRDQMIRLPLPAPLFYEGLLPLKSGSFALSPIHVTDVARIIIKSLAMPATVGQTFTLCGPEAIEWRAIIRLIAKACGTFKLTVPVPAFYIRILATLLESYEFFPVTRDQLTMLLEGNTGDSSDVYKLFDIDPIHFTEAALSYLQGTGARPNEPSQTPARHARPR